MQGLAVLQVPLHCTVGQALVQALTPIGQVVVTGNLDAGWRHRLVVGRDDIAARRVLLLRVVAERVVSGFLRFAAGAVEDKARIDPCRAARQLGRRPPANIASGVGPDHVEARCLDFFRSGAGLVQAVGAIELVEAVEDRVVGFQKGPPQGNRRLAGGVAEGIVDQRAVGRAAQGQPERFGVLDLDGLFAAL
ncbi:hypothetical protein D9M68_665860 [compost metagenome]